MSVIKQRDLERFKKTRQGLVEFAVILEQAAPKVREKIISEVGSLDPSFLRAALRKVVYFEEIVFLEESTVAEILSHISPKILAFALFGMDEDFCKKILGNLAFRTMRQVQDEQEKNTNPSSGMVSGARIQILRTARELEAKEKFVFELLDCPRFKTKSKGQLRLVSSK